MNIDSTITVQAPNASVPDVAARRPLACDTHIARQTPNVWAQERGDSAVVSVITAGILLLAAALVLTAFAHAFAG